VVMNDDVAAGDAGNGGMGGEQSLITGMFVPFAGHYYLAISRFNFDPMDNDGQLIWNDSPFDVERVPDAPGNPGPVARWRSLVPTAGGDYAITLSGACFPQLSPPCSPCPGDYDQSGGIDGSDIEAFFYDWERGAGCADVSNDGGVDGQDVGVFFAHWEAGEC